MSRKGPNLQNIPTRTPEGKRISDAFRKPGHGSAMDSITEQFLRDLGWAPRHPPRVESPVLSIALRGFNNSGVRRSTLKEDLQELVLEDMASGAIQPRDIHAEVARSIFGDSPPKDAAEAKARRSAAQVVGFSALYGGRQMAKI